MAKINDRINETNIANNGLMMKIIKYNNSKDIDVEFEDGYISRHKCYNAFKLGNIANPNFKSRVGTSVNEITMLYYFSQLGFYKKGVNKDTEFGRFEYDAFNKDLMLAIEYDGDTRTHTFEKDKRKNDDASRCGVTIWRVRAPELPNFKDNRNRFYKLENSWLFSSNFENVLKNILRDINMKFNTNYVLDIDLKRDKKKILSFLKENYYSTHNNRIGESVIAGNGQQMTIIDYIAFCDITVQFEDGTIVENVRYSDFRLGNIANPNFSTRAFIHKQERVGEEKIANNGLKMRIVEYRNCHDIDVEFENGEKFYHVGYNNFVRGKIGKRNFNKKVISKPAVRVKKPKPLSEHIGESIKAKNGLMATIIAYNKYSDIRVQFEDGVIVKATYDGFKEGLIRHPDFKRSTKLQRLGETNTSKDGKKMTIIGYNGVKDVDIQFEDGTIVRHREYRSFKNGTIMISKTKSDDYLNKTFTMNNGQKLTVIKYINGKNITVQFEDGTIVKNRAISNLLNGQISNPNFNPQVAQNASKIIGETRYNNAGFKMTVIDYKTAKNIAVQFEDGSIVEHCDYSAFKTGSIRKPIPSRIGERNKNAAGDEFEIIEYNSSRDITIKFLDDGTILRHKSYGDFKNGYFRKPKK